MNPQQIITAVHKQTRHNPLAPARTRNIVYARYLAIYYLSKFATRNDRHIAAIFGKERSCCSAARRFVRNGLFTGLCTEDINALNKILL